MIGKSRETCLVNICSYLCFAKKNKCQKYTHIHTHILGLAMDLGWAGWWVFVVLHKPDPLTYMGVLSHT